MDSKPYIMITNNVAVAAITIIIFVNIIIVTLGSHSKINHEYKRAITTIHSTFITAGNNR